MARDRLDIKCTCCGGGLFEIPRNPKPNDVIRCAGCGTGFRYDDLKAQAVEAGRKYVEDFGRNVFKKRR